VLFLPVERQKLQVVVLVVVLVALTMPGTSCQLLPGILVYSWPVGLRPARLPVRFQDRFPVQSKTLQLKGGNGNELRIWRKVTFKSKLGSGRSKYRTFGTRLEHVGDEKTREKKTGEERTIKGIIHFLKTINW
jgi:hypothetical protein